MASNGLSIFSGGNACTYGLFTHVREGGYRHIGTWPPSDLSLWEVGTKPRLHLREKLEGTLSLRAATAGCESCRKAKGVRHSVSLRNAAGSRIGCFSARNVGSVFVKQGDRRFPHAGTDTSPHGRRYEHAAPRFRPIRIT
eukprot:scaffold274085_cov28-Tisochrysis_lutea.AAC.2